MGNFLIKTMSQVKEFDFGKLEQLSIKYGLSPKELYQIYLDIEKCVTVLEFDSNGKCLNSTIHEIKNP